jgi:hypothetical protein
MEQARCAALTIVLGRGFWFGLPILQQHKIRMLDKLLKEFRTS